MTALAAEPAGPVILGLDAAGLATTVAVARGEAVIASEHHLRPHGQAEALLPMIDAAMRSAGLAPSAIDEIAVTIGPGSFTGIRAGLAAARGIALATGARLVGVTGFEAVAAASPPFDEPVLLLIALESRRDDLYVQLYAADGHPVSAAVSVLPAALAAWVSGVAGAAGVIIAGDAARRAAVALSGRALLAAAPCLPDAVAAIRAVGRRRQSGERDRPARPFYLRPADVTVAVERPPQREPGA